MTVTGSLGGTEQRGLRCADITEAVGERGGRIMAFGWCLLLELKIICNKETAKMVQKLTLFRHELLLPYTSANMFIWI